MAIKTYNPVTPVLRYKTTDAFDRITTDVPFKPLLVAKKRISGRNNGGRITSRHRGGGHKQHYRIIDFKRNNLNVPGVVETIEYDPNRTSYIALVKFADGDRRYVIATEVLKVGATIISADSAEPVDGNTMLLINMPLGSFVHNIEMREGKGGQIARTAGAHATVLAKEGDKVHLKMPSGEVRIFRGTCRATIGVVSNGEHMNLTIGSAGRKRHLGWRPHVRGVAMNPIDHPMGGGQGKTSGGGHPVSPWGQKAKGLKTRKKNKTTSKYIVRGRTK